VQSSFIHAVENVANKDIRKFSLMISSSSTKPIHKLANKPLAIF